MRLAGEALHIGPLKKQIHSGTQADAISLIKPSRSRTIEIEDAQKLPILDQRNDDLGTRCGIARDMPGKCADIRNDDGLPALGGCAADTLTQRNPYTGDLALEGA
jgi:hypothetical protein